MNSKEIANFRQLGDMMLPGLLDANFLRNIDDYGDYALLTYNLAEPVPIQTALWQSRFRSRPRSTTWRTTWT